MNGLKTIAVNLAGISASAKDGSLQTNKTAKALQTIGGIDVFADKKKGQLKSMTQILDELAGKWKGFTDEQKAGISEGIAGRQQAAVFRSLMQNYEVFNKARQQLNNGDQFGSMENENARFVESLSGQLNRLKETWIGIFNDLFDPSMFAGLVQDANVVSEAIAQIVSALKEMGVLKPLIAGIMASLAFKGISKATSTASTISTMTQALTSLATTGTLVRTGTTAVAEGLEVAGAAAVANAGRTTLLGSALTGVGTKFAGLAGILGAAAPWLLGIGAAVGVAYLAYDHFNVSLDEQSAILNKSINGRKSEIKGLDSQKKSLQGLQKEYDNLNSKTNKSKDDTNRIKELNKEIAKIKPDLVVGKDSDGNPILAMTGNVKDLIKEIDTAKERKKQLLAVDQRESGTNAIKQLNGSASQNTPNQFNNQNANTEMGKLEQITEQHVNKMNSLENKRDKILNKMYGTTGKERRELLKDLEKANYNIEKEQGNFTQSYGKQLSEVQKLSSKIGTGIFSGIENTQGFTTASKNIQKDFKGLKSVLDFSDIKTEGQMDNVEFSLNKLLGAAKNGKVDLGALKNSINDANVEFAKTGDVGKYEASIGKLVDQISKASGVDKNVLKDIFEGIDTSAAKGENAINKFLNAYGKSVGDLNNNDGFAKALLAQKKALEDSIQGVNEALGSGDIEIQKQVTVDLINNQNLPEQLRTMIATLLRKGADQGEVLQFAQKLMLDMSDGEIDIDKVNKEIKDKFGEDSFEITPEIMLNGASKVAGVDTVISQLQSKFGELPPTVTTIIKAEGITSYTEANRILSLYNSFPPEVQTVITNNGLETSKDLSLIDQLYKTLPPEIATQIITNFPNVVKDSKTVDDVLNGIPPMITSEIMVKASTEEVQSVADALTALPIDKQVTIDILNGMATGNIDMITSALNSLPPEKRVQVVSEIGKALDGIGTVEAKNLKNKILKIDANSKPASDKITTIENKKINPKSVKINTSGHQTAIGALDKIKNAKNKSVTLTITQKIKQIGSLIGGGIKKVFGAGNVTKKSNITVQTPASVQSSPSPMPMSTGASSSPTPVSTGSAPSAASVPSSSSPVPVSTGETTQETPIAIENDDINASLEYNVDLLKELENRYKKLNAVIDKYGKSLENASGRDRISILRAQNKLYQEKLTMLNKENEYLSKQQSYLKSQLTSKGVTFNEDGNFTNYEELLLKREAEVKRLEKLSESASDESKKKDPPASKKKSKNEKTKEKTDSYNKKMNSEDAKKKYEEAKQQLDNFKKYMDEYNKITFEQMLNVDSNVIDIKNAIQNNIEAIKEFNEEVSKLKYDSRQKDENRDINEVQNKLDTNQLLIEMSTGERLKELLQERLNLQGQLRDETNDLLKVEKQRRDVLMTDLSKYGFNFRDDGSIKQYGGVIKDLKNSLPKKEFDEVFGKVEEYLNSTYEKIPNIEQEVLKMNSSFKDSMEKLQQVDITQVNKDIERSDEEQLLELLNKKKTLQTELVDKKKQYIDLLNEEGLRIKENLKDQGVKFDENGTITNLQSIVDSYNTAIEKTNDIETKNKLRKELDDIRAGTDAYVRVTESEIPVAIEEWKDAQFEVKKTGDEIKKVEDANAKFAADKAKAVKNATLDIIKVTQELIKTQLSINRKQIELLQKESKLASFDYSKSYENMQQQVDLLNKRLGLQKKYNAEVLKEQQFYKNDLVQFGIQFNEEGIATNAESILEGIQKQMASAKTPEELSKLEEKFKDITSALGDYNDTLVEVVENQGELLDIRLEIEGIYKDMLETTKKVQDKISDILKENAEKRKKIIDDELKARLDAIQKEQDAFNKQNKEDDFEKEKQKQLTEIAKIKALIDAVSRDTSNSGQAKLNDLIKDLTEKQEAYNDFIKNKLNENINEEFDNAKEQMQKDAEKAKEDIDKTLEKDKLYETINEALKTGVIADINGNIVSLKDALLDYENRNGDGLSAVGSLIGKDILSQLDVSVDTMKNIANILNTFDPNKMFGINSFKSPENKFNNVTSNTSKAVQFNAPLLSVQGNVAQDTMPQLQNMIKDAEKRITQNIMKNM